MAYRNEIAVMVPLAEEPGDIDLSVYWKLMNGKAEMGGGVNGTPSLGNVSIGSGPLKKNSRAGSTVESSRTSRAKLRENRMAESADCH